MDAVPLGRDIKVIDATFLVVPQIQSTVKTSVVY